MTTVVGWDLSLTGTGVARITTTPGYLSALGEVSDTEPRVTLSRIASTGKRGATLTQRTDRLMHLRNAILSATLRGGAPDLVIVEGPAFASQVGQMWDRAALWHLCIMAAYQQGLPVVECAPTKLKKFITGKGNADKTAVTSAITRMWPAVTIGSDDEADALGLASIAAVHHRLPVPFLVLERHREAMAGLDLPERPTR
ncbi:hypothetical protein TPB0596_12130 [Tsukamurella pulmonis]|uniref:crossover junction endodeoxyribonuclease RuvC n=1 Tax=Tsukamurella pulmonis TaxID=47312 RepID=UPI001EDED9A9|nr:crossover junction endodeoxyribonuclease RuvC [Tsukamurella pulmonis]BDD81450.1 hypothetical protein TPB0596_12130 [Tsukamurella pulmonis]